LSFEGSSTIAGAHAVFHFIRLAPV
jgi:hypothetical protein